MHARCAGQAPFAMSSSRTCAVRVCVCACVHVRMRVCECIYVCVRVYMCAYVFEQHAMIVAYNLSILHFGELLPAPIAATTSLRVRDKILLRGSDNNLSF
jgi:hypothetical protein